MITSDGSWKAFGVSEGKIRASAERLGERRQLPQRVHRFFEQAGALMLHSWYSYPFASIAFFHAVLGVEKALRLAYDASESDRFRILFERSVEQGIVHDGIFAEIVPIRKEFAARVPKGFQSHAEVLAKLVPELRNEYFHGGYIMADDFLPLSLRLREVADVLAPQRKPNKAPEPTPVAVMPRATSRFTEVKLQKQKRSEARVTPATGVAHL